MAQRHPVPFRIADVKTAPVDPGVLGRLDGQPTRFEPHFFGVVVIARDFEVDPQLLQGDTGLQDLAIDSLGVIEIMFAVEEEFGITMPHAAPGTNTPLNTFDDLAEIAD